MDSWIEAEKNCLPSILEDLEWEIEKDFEEVYYSIRTLNEWCSEISGRQLIRRGRQYLALKRRLQFD